MSPNPKRNSTGSIETPTRGLTLVSELGAPPKYSSYAEEILPSDQSLLGGDVLTLSESDLADAIGDLDLDHLDISESPAGGSGFLLLEEDEPKAIPYGASPLLLVLNYQSYV
jgi:hypothetical protein